MRQTLEKLFEIRIAIWQRVDRLTRCQSGEVVLDRPNLIDGHGILRREGRHQATDVVGDQVLEKLLGGFLEIGHGGPPGGTRCRRIVV